MKITIIQIHPYLKLNESLILFLHQFSPFVNGGLTEGLI